MVLILSCIPRTQMSERENGGGGGGGGGEWGEEKIIKGLQKRFTW